MRPEWFPVDAVPFDRMWADDRHWFPYVLAKKPFTAFFRFRGETEILVHEINEVPELPDVPLGERKPKKA
jgi:8-oxo-dGTP diphosphatase/2-hydroxy-dATP diphosphatase